MGFYDLSKNERQQAVEAIKAALCEDLVEDSSLTSTITYFSDPDTYVRKAAYLSLSKLYFAFPKYRDTILKRLDGLMVHADFRIRQTVINTAGEIGKKDFGSVMPIFDKGLLDGHHSPRNAVVGSIKKMGEVNPAPVLKWARSYLHHQDKEIRREICHGIELRGRKHPEDILPLLKELQHDKTARVRNTLVHVIGQIAYKKGCLQKVLDHLRSWENQDLVEAALEEIIDVHERYKTFAAMSQDEARKFIATVFG
ncbi:HEAT repeat domain-containing protein [Negadavirga shengliensis]|uniref:HEAT repeat domain-containing protein n=1 Tax=Negadavirga shengliensis TaxID=1389218 RepID=A0ABV9SVR3_9BACT